MLPYDFEANGIIRWLQPPIFIVFNYKFVFYEFIQVRL